MRLKISPSANAKSFYVIESIRRNGVNSSRIIEKLGTEKQIREKYGVEDAEAWARAYVDNLNDEAKTLKDVKRLIEFSADKLIPEGKQFSYNAGYLFLQKVYYQLGIPGICTRIKKNHSFSYDLNAILSRLVYGRILFPSSKLSCFEQSSKFIEQPSFDSHQIYRALSVLSEESDYIQAQLYKNSAKVLKRSTGVLFYDCTNYFFELEQESGLKQYGPSKENRPNPIVQMGLFMDKSGIPLAFCINKGNQNEQLSLKPLEEQIMKDFGLSKFVVCTDAGLSSEANRKFNNFGNRCFITTQSLKKIKSAYRDWALESTGWHLEGDSKTYDISKLEDTEENRKLVFYKQRLIEGWDEERDIDFTQNLIVTYSLKYKAYQESLRERQLTRVAKLIDNPSLIEKKRSNDVKRYISKSAVTPDGEVASKNLYQLDEELISDESKYDGFYAVCTNLDDDPSVIAKINHDRWEIEESFRIMKYEFKARPVYLQRDDRIKAHFLTCFIALMIYRILEKQLNEQFTCDEIISTIKEMNMTKLEKHGFIPSYTRTALTDALHKNAGFRTDYEITTDKGMAGVIRRTKGL